MDILHQIKLKFHWVEPHQGIELTTEMESINLDMV